MSEHRYGRRSIMGDYLRSIPAVLIFAWMLLGLEMTRTLTLFFSALLAIFVVYAMRNFVRHKSCVLVDEVGIAISGPLSKAVRWSDMIDLRANYYGTRRDGGRSGWMELVIKGKRKTVRIDSMLEGFNDIARLAVTKAVDAGLDLSPRSVVNLRAIGIVAEVEG